jgi:hypothetical protein
VDQWQEQEPQQALVLPLLLQLRQWLLRQPLVRLQQVLLSQLYQALLQLTRH